MFLSFIYSKQFYEFNFKKNTNKEKKYFNTFIIKNIFTFEKNLLTKITKNGNN